MASAQTELEVVEAQRILTLVQAKKTAEDAAAAALATAAAATTASARVKSLAVQLHTLLCTTTHEASAVACTWRSETSDYDVASDANWTKAAHALWLSRSRSGIKAMRDLGFTVTDPT